MFNDHLKKEISDKCLRKNLTILLKILIPFTPHLAYECLEILGEKEIKSWPKIDAKLILKEKTKMAIQLNGKTKSVIEIDKGLNQTAVEKICKESPKIKDKIFNFSITKVIFVKDRIINFIIKP